MLSVGTSYITVSCINYLFCACGIEFNFFFLVFNSEEEKGLMKKLEAIDL